MSPPRPRPRYSDRNGRNYRKRGDRTVLATEERHGALVDHVGDVLHLRRPGVATKDVAGEPDGVQDGRYSGDWY
jgi:hypothetical protein